ncbi:MAG: hypothetical protein FWE92_04115 [Defluviitaleaceae bacterium]|nr:hypothetical protein [Defluviitaleaceae bacterium]
MLTPQGMWTVWAIISTNNENILVVIIALFAIAIIITVPKLKRVYRKWLCLAVVAIAAFVVASSMDFGGSLYGEWELERDARVESIRFAESSNFRLYFAEDGSVLMTAPDLDTVEESAWQKRRVVRDIVVIESQGGFEYRFSNFGRRLILNRTGELPRIPILTTQRDLEIVFRRVR